MKLKSNTEESTDDTLCLTIDPVSVDNVKEASAWFADLAIQGGSLNVKLDTGPEVSILLLRLYNELQIKPPPKPTSIRFTAYGETPITPTVTCKLTCSSPAQNRWDVNFYVTQYKLTPYWDCMTAHTWA